MDGFKREPAPGSDETLPIENILKGFQSRMNKISDLFLWRYPWVRLETYETFTSNTIFGSIRSLESTCPSTHKLQALSINVVLKKVKGYPRIKIGGKLKKKAETETQELTKGVSKGGESSPPSPLPHSSTQTDIYSHYCQKNKIPLNKERATASPQRSSQLRPAVRQPDVNSCQIFS